MVKIKGLVKLRQSGRPKKLTLNHHQQQRPQGPSEALEIVVEDEPRTPVSINHKIKQACQDNEARSWSELSIYRIPHYLKLGEDKAYVPQIVSLGPYHHGKKHLRQMNQHKWRCIHRILKRTNLGIGSYLDSVKKVQKRARACYEGKISMSDDKFVEMMVLDGCFVLELFQGFHQGFKELGYPDDDPVFSMQGSMNMIQRDMIMLENQIPLVILEELLAVQLGDPNKKGHVANLALHFFGLKPMDGRPTNPSSNSLEFDTLLAQSKLHCLGLFRQCLLPSRPSQTGTKGSSQRRQQFIHCVTELREAGIKFTKSESNRILDIKFGGGSLQIPQLLIDDGTRSLFSNLIAYEQCHFGCSNDITSYVIFMDHLINSPEDVGHLHHCGIIEHWLGSDAEVADLFNGLCQEVVFDSDDSYLSTLSAEVNNYSSHRCYRWCFLLKHKYFSNPWSIISFIAAVVLLMLTSAQTFYGVYGYYRPGS